MASQEQSGINSFVNALESSGAIIKTPTGGFAINPAVPAIANFVDGLPSALLHSSETGGGDYDADNINFTTLLSGAVQDAIAGTLGATVGLGIDYSGSYYSLSSDGEFSYGSDSALPNGSGNVEVGSSFGPTGESPLSVEYEQSNGQYYGWDFGPGGGPFSGADTNQSKLSSGAEIYNQMQTPGFDTNNPIPGGLPSHVPSGFPSHVLSGFPSPVLNGFPTDILGSLA